MAESETAWEDALLAIRIVDVARHRVGGIHLRARAGPVRDIWLQRLQNLLTDVPHVRFSPDIDEGRLLGDLDLSRTLVEGKPVIAEGLLARADKGMILLAMAERAEPTLCGILAGAMDTGTAQAGKTSQSVPRNARFTLVALDEGADETENLPAALSDRLALRVDLTTVSYRIAQGDLEIPDAPRSEPETIAIPDAILTALATAAQQAGWDSMRPVIWLSMVSKIIAVLDGSNEVTPVHASRAIRLVFGPVILSEYEDEPAEEADDTPPPPPPPDEQQDNQDESEPSEIDLDALKDMLIAAEAARTMTLPIILPAGSAGANANGSGKAGAQKDQARRGRPIGFSTRPPYPGAKPHILATLRAAAPWQRIRQRERGDAGAGRLDIRPSDFRYRRLKDRTESTVIFAVDASGSTALARLGEAKGAVEMLLAECYVRRDSVAVIAFRGLEADVLLEPTRSLVRAKRSLGRLPGGGPTPLASAMAKSLEMTARVMREGQSPLLVIMTDGNANIALDGSMNREQAREDVAVLARQLAVLPMQIIMIDISARPRESARTFAASLRADYVALPRTDAKSVSRLVSTYLQDR